MYNMNIETFFLVKLHKTEVQGETFSNLPTWIGTGGGARPCFPPLWKAADWLRRNRMDLSSPIWSCQKLFTTRSVPSQYSLYTQAWSLTVECLINFSATLLPKGKAGYRWKRFNTVRFSDGILMGWITTSLHIGWVTAFLKDALLESNHLVCHHSGDLIQTVGCGSNIQVHSHRYPANSLDSVS